MITKSKKDIQDFYAYNSFFELLVSTKKYKEIYNSKETVISIFLSILTSIIFNIIYRNVNIDIFNELIRSILMDISLAYLGILGFIVSGLAIISGTISYKAVDEINKDGVIDALIGILFSFYFAGVLLGIALISYIIMFLMSYLDFYVTTFRLVAITFSLSYMFWFIVMYSISLLGSCLKIFLVNYKYSKDREE